MRTLQRAFTYETNQVRTVTREGEVWFVAKDVVNILNIDISQTRRLTKKQKGLYSVQTLKGTQNMIIINEAGLYKLIFTSRKPDAEQFTNWVAEKVLPSIKRHGVYMTDEAIEKSIEDPDYIIGLLTGLKEERLRRTKAENTLYLLTHVDKTYTATEIAKELGLKSAIQLNEQLQNKSIQFKQGGTWVLYSKYADKGYVEIKQEVVDNGKIIYSRRFTQLGREFLLQLYGVNKKEARCLQHQECHKKLY